MLHYKHFAPECACQDPHYEAWVEEGVILLNTSDFQAVITYARQNGLRLNRVR